MVVFASSVVLLVGFALALLILVIILAVSLLALSESSI